MSSESIVFFALLAAAGTWLLAEPARRLVGAGPLAWVLAVITSFALVAGIGPLSDRLNRAAHPVPETCPECGGSMSVTGASFDGWLPTGQDVVIFALFAAAVWALRAIV